MNHLLDLGSRKFWRVTGRVVDLGFDVDRLRPEIRDFYEHTAAWQLEVWTGWSRTLRSSGRHVFSGAYSARTLPGVDSPSVHVAFPLESGNVQVFLRPSVTDGGGLRTDHELRLRRTWAVRLHYKLQRAS